TSAITHRSSLITHHSSLITHHSSLILILFFQWLAAGETVFDLVPPADVVGFADLPAEEDDAAVAHRGEVDKAAFVIFELDAGVGDLDGELADIVECLDVGGPALHTAAAIGGGRGGACGFAKPADRLVVKLDQLELHADPRQQRVSFVHRKELHGSSVIRTCREPSSVSSSP